MAKGKSAGKNGYPLMIWILWIVLALIGIVWNQERTLYQDSAYAVFRICNLQFPIEHGRWGLAPLMVPAWLAAKAGMSVGWVTSVLSFSGIAIPALSSWIIWRVNREGYLYLVPLFCITLTGPEWFFLGIAEMVIAICYASLFLAFLFRSDSWKQWQLYAAFFFVLVAFHTHPGVLPLLLFISVFHFSIANNKLGVVAFCLIILFAVLKKYVTSNTGYEEEVLGRASDWENMKNTFGSWTWSYFKGSFMKRMLIPSLLFLTGLVLLRDRIGRFGFFYLPLTAILGLMSIIVIFSVGDSDMMMEKNFAPMVVALLIPFAFSSLKSSGANIFFLVISIGLVGFGVYQRYGCYQFFHERLARMDALLMDKEVRPYEKVYYPASRIDPEKWHATWAFPYESVLRSMAAEGKCKTIKLYTEKPEPEVLKSKGLFYGADFAYKINTDTLNRVYYPFTPESKYHLVTESGNDGDKR